MEHTMADQVAALFDNDGQRFNLDDGRTIHAVMVEDFGAVVDRSGGFVDSPVAYRFADGSGIVAIGDGWDIEGDEPFTWKGG